MLSIRLRREGKRNQPVYRLIVVDKTKDPWGDYLENLGTYNPRRTPSDIAFNVDRIKSWLEKGAQPSDTVRNLLIDQKIMTGEKAPTITISKKRRAALDAKKKEKAEAEASKQAAHAEAPAAEAAPELQA
jgi:small subunit ribosomal protein S16